jgi:GNAT superfamily N-acetyltransferase
LTIRVANINEENVEDALNVCTNPARLSDTSLLEGLEIRRKWLLGIYREMGSCAKIAYVADKPVGIIQYTPLHAIPYYNTRRRDVLYIHCMDVQEEFRNRGIGSALLEAVKSEMLTPNSMFKEQTCSMLATSARKHYGYIQFGLFKAKGFRKTRNNIDLALICPLSKSETDTKLDVPATKPLTIQERGVKIFFKPTCQYCKITNEMIKSEIRRINDRLKIEECNLWTCYLEALRRGITSVTTYINGHPVLPMEPEKFARVVRRLSRAVPAKSNSLYDDEINQG